VFHSVGRSFAPLRVLAVIVSTLPAAALLAAATFHVAVLGDDLVGDGSAGEPWATIGHAVETVPDGSLILVAPGTYSGRVRLDRAFAAGVTIRSEVPYQARLRHTATVVTVFEGQGITLQGFDIAHSGPGAGPLVVQIQDLIGDPGPAGGQVERITLRDNVIHDSFDNDLLKINNGARLVLLDGNLFYNQAGSDEHIDVNSVTDVEVRDNVFFNDFAGSGRTNLNDTSGFVVIKDSNGVSDALEGAARVTIRRNVFLNWEGGDSEAFVQVGEDGNESFEAEDVLVENNLMLGNSANPLRAAFGVKGCRGVTFRHNTIAGDLPSYAFAFRLNTEGSNPPNELVVLRGNAWYDPTGTMGHFADTPAGQTTSWTFDGNLYWNGGVPIPTDGDLIDYDDDANGAVADPLLPSQDGLVVPRWSSDAGLFADGSGTIAQAFRRLVDRYGRPTSLMSPLVDAAAPAGAPLDDILANPRGDAAPDLGALEADALFGDGFEAGAPVRWSTTAG
jgi:hypothetical protein